MWGPSEFTITGTLRKLNLLPDLHEIKVPVLLVCGDHDEAGTKTVKDYQTAFSDARLAVIPNASHLHHLEQPGIFKEIVNRFLNETDTTDNEEKR
jgi:proline iminopeptidase